VRYLILAASVLIQVCLGGIYAWSAFVPALREGYSLSVAQTQLIFGLTITVFTVAMVFAGRLLERLGPRLVASTGAVLFGAGYVIASLSQGSFAVLLVGISILTGAGTGFGYVCPLATCVKWFPSNKGLVTGVAVAGFGGGAILLSAASDMLFGHGVSVLTVFRWIGIVYGSVILGAAFVLASPASDRTEAKRPALALNDLARDRVFWALVFGIFCGTFAGLVTIGNLKPMALASGLSPAAATLAISAFAAGNASGRIAWGWIADRIGSRAIPLSLGVLAVVVCGFIPVSSRPEGFALLSALVGFGFGACFVVYAAQAASRYGSDNVGSVYPLVFLAYGLAGVIGPWIGGRLYDETESYMPAVATGAAVVLAGLLISSWLLWSASNREHSRMVASTEQ
jgi:MFS transporter, OFA family, oxalate/formate antiporter